MFSRSLFYSVSIASASFLFANAQDIPSSASAFDLAYVDAEYENSGYGNVSENNQGFGFPLESKVLLSTAYNSTVIENGNSYAADQTQAQPNFYVTFSNETLDDVRNVSDWTLILADANTWGNPDPEGSFRHFLASQVTVQGDIPTEGNMTLPLEIGNVITPYAGPGPAEGDGPHRYAFLLFAGNPAENDIQNDEGTPLSENGHWNVTEYVQAANLTGPYGATLFTVENGEAAESISVVSTSAVDTATLPAATSTDDASASSTPSDAANNDEDGSANTLTIGKFVGAAALLNVAIAALA